MVCWGHVTKVSNVVASLLLRGQLQIMMPKCGNCHGHRLSHDFYGSLFSSLVVSIDHVTVHITGMMITSAMKEKPKAE